MVVFARIDTIEPNRFPSAFRSLQGLIAILCTSTLIWIVGCGESATTAKPSSRPGSATASPSTETKSDVLAEILQLAKSGDNGQLLPSLGSRDKTSQHDDGSTDIDSGPQVSDDKKSNRLATVAGESYLAIIRLYGPTEAAIETSWKAGDFQQIKSTSD